MDKQVYPLERLMKRTEAEYMLGLVLLLAMSPEKKVTVLPSHHPEWN